MIAKEGTIVRLLDGTDKKFIIPVYQRPYSWKKENCKLLFEDLMTAYKKGSSSHFFGSIVYVENDVGGINEYQIIDGQQRLTTVSLLLLAIRNYLESCGIVIDGINCAKITDAYLTDKYANDEKKLKLKLVQGDDDAYDRLIERTTPVENNGITVNYNYFYSEISSLEDAEIKGLYDALTKLSIVNISLKPSDGDDPQLIFESLNSTGKDLEESDKIRNYVLMRISSDRQKRVYKNYWEKLEKKVEKTELTGFIRHYLAVKTRELYPEAKLYFAFKAFREKSNKEIEDILDDILRFADYYKIIKESKITDSGYRCALARINKLEVNTVTPLLFDLFVAKNANRLDDDSFCKAIEIIESFLIRRMFCSLPTAPLNKLFVYAGDEIEKNLKDSPEASFFDVFVYSLLSKTGKSRFPSDHEFDEKFPLFELYNAKSSSRKFVFERLENSKSKERVAVEDQLNNGELTIEHIMPQTLSEDWKTYLGSEWELIHTKYQHTLGNLTLTAYNSDYSNLPYEKKLNMPDKGILHSKLMLNEKIKGIKVWNKDAIINRATLLLSWAKGIWSIPTTQFKPNIGEEWVSLDDDYDFTDKVITKMVLLGDEYITDTVADAYKKFCSQMYNLDPIAFNNTSTRYHSSDKKQLGAPFELAKDTYIETKLSSPDKVNAIKSIAEKMGIDISADIRFLVHSKQKKKGEGAPSIAKRLFEDLEKAGKLTDTDIVALQEDGELRKTLKSRSGLPILVDADFADGLDEKRYFKNYLFEHGEKKYYLCDQFYPKDIPNLRSWYDAHMKN